VQGWAGMLADAAARVADQRHAGRNNSPSPVQAARIRRPPRAGDPHLAAVVLPVPGGPTSSTPRGRLVPAAPAPPSLVAREISSYTSGLARASNTLSSSSRFSSEYPAQQQQQPQQRTQQQQDDWRQPRPRSTMSNQACATQPGLHASHFQGRKSGHDSLWSCCLWGALTAPAPAPAPAPTSQHAPAEVLSVLSRHNHLHLHSNSRHA
jgi:hypothetical protein